MSTATPSLSVEREDLNPCTIQLIVSCPPEIVREGFQKTFKQLSKKVRVPGFRPGQAPRAVLEKMIAPQEIHQEALESIVTSAFKKALQQEDIKPEGQPAVKITKYEPEEEALDFTAKIPLAPKVELAEYKGLTVEKPVRSVSDDDVEYFLEDLRRRSGKREAVTGRGIQEGDVAVVNIKPEGDTEGRNFMVISGQTFEGLDKAILGMSAEEIKSAELSFPDNFQEADWANTKAKCTITIRSVSTNRLPELDDEFAKSLEADDLTTLKERIRQVLEGSSAQTAQSIVNDRLLDTVLNTSTIHVADTTWEGVADRRLADIQRDLQEKGRTLEQHAQENGMSLEEFAEAQRQEAKLHVERAVVIENIFRAEKLEISNEDANRLFYQIAQENNVPEDQLQKFAKEYRDQIREEVIFRGMYSKVVEFLNEHAQVTEVAEGGSAPAPAPKKPAAKKSTKKKSAPTEE